MVDQVSQDLVNEALARAKQGDGVSRTNLDDISKRLVDEALTRARGSDKVDPLVLDTSKDWDFGREAIDAATFGAFSKTAPQHVKDAQDIWRKHNSGKAAIAKELGQTAPEMVASTLLGQSEVLLASKLAKLPELAKFLTGSNEGNALMRLGSQATWGAQQGLTTAGIENYFGKDADLGGAAVTGGLMGPASNLLFSPLHSSISPEIAQFAQDYMRTTGSKLNLSQIPGAPYAARAIARLTRMNRSDLPGLTGSLMRSTGLDVADASPSSIARARAGIKQRLEQAIPSSQATGLSDDQMGAVFQQLGNVFGAANTPQAQAVRLAQNQWINAQKIERMAQASRRSDNLIDPDVVSAEVRSGATGYPGGLGPSAAAAASGNPVDLGVLARGANQFTQQGAGPGGHLGTGAALGLGGVLGAAHEYIGPLVEHALPFAPVALGAGAAVSAAGSLMENPLYLNLLLRGGGKLGPVGDPLIPSAVEWYGNKMSPTSPANAATGTPVRSGSANVEAAIQAAADRSGLDPKYIRAIASIESGNDPASNYSKATQYKGLFQINNGEFQQNGGGNIYDPKDNALAFAGIAKSNVDWFKSRFGRDPSPTQVYMMHLQGRGFYDKGTMTNVAGNPYPGMSGPQTPASFEAGWGRELERRANALAGVQISAGPTSSGLTSVLQPITGAGPSQDEIANILAGSQ